MNYYDKDAECMDRETIRELQSKKLVAQVKRMYERVELFRKRMDEAGLKPSDVHSIDDLKRLPFSYKRDLRDYYPYGLFAEPMKNIIKVHASSGTTGKQIVVGYTKNDIKIWQKCVCRALVAAGADENDIVQDSYGYGLFTGGLGLHDGICALGATAIPASSGNTERQIRTMIDFKATGIACTPSYAMYLGETIAEKGVRDKLSLRFGIFGAEPWTNTMRKAIEEKLGIKAYDIYGLSEIMGPGVSFECSEQAGMHINEDEFVAEIIDPDTGEVLPEGAEGELVFTTLSKEGFPLIRYRTRDICSLNYEMCKCGRTFVRMNKPTGRSDDMLIIRGVNVFPSQIEEVLLKMDNAVTPNYLIVVDRVNNTDTLEVRVEMSEDLQFDDIKSIENVERQIHAKLQSTLGLSAKVRLVEPKSITRSEGKAKRVIDKRKLV